MNRQLRSLYTRARRKTKRLQEWGPQALLCVQLGGGPNVNVETISQDIEPEETLRLNLARLLGETLVLSRHLHEKIADLKLALHVAVDMLRERDQQLRNAERTIRMLRHQQRSRRATKKEAA